MTHRTLQWVGAGVLATGLSTVTLIGVGVAAAAADAGDGGAGTTSSQSTDGVTGGAGANTASQSNSTDTEANSADEDGTETKPADGTTDPQRAAGPDGHDATDEDATEEQATDGEEAVEEEETTDYTTASAGDDPETVGADHALTNDTSDASAAKGQQRDSTPAVDTAGTETDTNGAETKTEKAVATAAASMGVDSEVTSTTAAEEETPFAFDNESAPGTVRLVMSAVEEEEPAPAPSLINVVGTFFWGLFDLFSTVISGPPAVPPGSTVTAGRSTLQIDCGDGYTADADWYFPSEDEPDRFIYFQHGFPGTAAFYDLTLAELAERNNAIVVAPSITGNVFACDACNLTGDPMHAAVAKLFEGDRAALLASAAAAGYEGTLPEQFVFVGQSHGGQLAAGAARYYREFAPVDEKSDLVGAVLFDSSSAGGALARALDKLPADFPILHISAAPAPLNTFGSADAVFEQERPGQFNGIQLVGGTHSDGFRSSAVFGLAQFVVELSAGASKPENVEAVQGVTEGWINDMYEGRVFNPATWTGIYGEPGEPGEAMVVDIPTDAGLAQGYVLPAPTTQLTRLLSLVLGFFFELPTASASTAAPWIPVRRRRNRPANWAPWPHRTPKGPDGRTPRGACAG